MGSTKLHLALKKLSFAVCCSMIVAFFFSGCKNDVYDPNHTEETKEANHFDFATTSSIQLNVKYKVPEGYKVLFEVFLEDPMTTTEDGQYIKRTDISPVIVRMTDGQGAYNAKENITANFGKEIYIYSADPGVPEVFKAEITDLAVHADINPESLRNQALAVASTRAIWTAPQGYYALGSWDENGYPDYLDPEGTLELSATLLNTIKKTFPEKGTCPEKYRQAIDFSINDPKGRDAEVTVRLIYGKGYAASTFGYYCYKEGATQNEINNAKKYIIFPNTNLSYPKRRIALSGGEAVKLHYIDENGTDQGTVFPNGTKIGWFLLPNAFDKYKKVSYFSMPGLNKDKRTHTAAFRMDNFVVLSFEDGADYDYNDVIFNVKSNPIEAIVTPDVPEVEPENGEEADKSVAYSITYKGILAFEDNWPNKGDYDLNDVIVKYNSLLHFNTKNEVLSAEDTFTALWSGASYKNAFAYQLNTERNNVTSELIQNPVPSNEQGLDAELSQATINVFSDALDAVGNNTKTTTIRVKNTFSTPISHETFGVPPYNPFITINGLQGASRNEVHLINHRPTDKFNTSLFYTGNDLSDPAKGIYYVTDGNYPFALHLVNAENFATTEQTTIDQSYPDFTKWVNSGGTEYKDWYK